MHLLQDCESLHFRIGVLFFLSSIISWTYAVLREPDELPNHYHARALEKRDRYWDRQIRCIGPMFGGITAELTGGPTRYSTPRKFCAAQEYGGLPGYNMGGFCDRFHGGPIVLFTKWPDLRNGLPPVEDPSNPRIAQRRFYDKSLTFCTLRCRCIQLADNVMPVQQSRVRHWPAQEIIDSEAIDRRPTYDVNPVPYIDNDPDQRDPRFSPILKVPFGNIDNFQSVGLRFWHIASRTDYRAPICLNQLPQFIAQPFSSNDFVTAQQLCASNFHGGNRQGNAGAVCSLVPGSTAGGIWGYQLKLLDYLAHPSFQASNGQLGLSINVWCRSICFCSPELSSKQRESIPLSLRGLTDVKATFSNGKVYVKNADGSNPVFGGPTILGQPGPGNDERTYDSLRMCSLLAANICFDTGSSISLLQDQDSSKCRLGSCRGAGQCGGSGCKCIAWPGLDLMHQAGYGPGLLQRSALCIGSVALSAAAAVSVAGKGVGSRLPKRDLSPLWACPCNQSYVSEACCDIDETGLVWEDPALSLGSLDSEDELLLTG